jgi:hypothetical protein
MVLTLEAQTRKSKEMPHTHSIVMHEEDSGGLFDFEELLDFLQAANVTNVADELSSRYMLWTKKGSLVMTRRLNAILRDLDRHAAQASRDDRGRPL